MSRVLMVNVEPPWPAQHGGRLRVARVAETLARQMDVLVAFPDKGTRDAHPPVATRPLRWTPPSSVRSRASRRPHLGGHHLFPVRDELSALVHSFRPDAVYWTHSYLAPWAPPALQGVPALVEFANIEGQRLRTLAESASGGQRAVRMMEARKAASWEPQAARAAAACVALSSADAQTLRDWGANVLLAPNGVDPLPYTASPADGYALAIASYDYEPNVTAVRALVHDVWPLVRGSRPQARLVVAGRASERLRTELQAVTGVEVTGTLDDVRTAYDGAALCLAPATTGGGSQLKVTEAMSRGRVVVMTPFAAAGMPEALRGSEGYRVAEWGQPFADAIIAAWDSPSTRHRGEQDGWQRCQQHSWEQTLKPIVSALAELRMAGSLG